MKRCSSKFAQKNHSNPLTSIDFAFTLRGMKKHRWSMWPKVLALGLLSTLGIVPAVASPADPLADFLAQNGWLTSPAEDASLRPAHSRLVVHALGFVGVPYRLGGGSYEEGFDCSGFVQASFQESLGIRLPRRVVEQAHATTPIEPSELIPGDLVFFNTLGSRYSHVGIYVGEGRFVHSPRTGASIRLESMYSSYWARRFTGARRVAWSDGAQWSRLDTP